MKTITTLLLLAIATTAVAEKTDIDLFVFVGEKISVTRFEPKLKEGEYLMDRAFKAKYKVLKNIHQDIGTNTIQFTAFDHYGIPPFSEYDHVLLYVVKEEGEYYHCKYQYAALYKTKDNKWAGIFPGQILFSYKKKEPILPVKITFEPSVEFDISEYDQDQIKDSFPKPFFEVKNGKAIPRYGYYINELFRFKKEGVLKNRGYFE